MKEWKKEEIREFRKALRLSQEKFAKLLGVSRVYVMMLETGKRKPSSVLKKLLDCLEEKQRKNG
jgi:DNA-binding transcriptional regulator YiaG